jgi:hypothetical protein
LTHLQGEAVVADEEVLEKLERNSTTLPIMGWWLCTIVKMECKFEEKMRVELIVGEFQSRDTLVVNLQRELENNIELMQKQNSLYSELHPHRELIL